MADTKISALTAATTPLAGTEVLPIVQSGVTKKVAVSDLTAGRAVSALNLTLTGKSLTVGTTLATWYANSVVAQIGTGGVIEARDNYAPSMAIAANAYIDTAGNDVYLTTNYATRFEQSGGVMRWKVAASGTAGTNISFTTALTLDQSFNLSFYSGNIVQGTAAKGINFTANTPAASMTSQLLNWYEEGTFTPTVIGATSAGTGTYTYQIGRYTRIGRIVTFNIRLNWSAHTGTGDMLIGGLPFTSANVTSGGYANATAVTANPENISMTAGNIMQAVIYNNTTNITLIQGPTGGGAVTAVPMDSSAYIVLSGSYEV